MASRNLSMIALLFALIFYCRYRAHAQAFIGLWPGSERALLGQLFSHSGSTLISNVGATQALLPLEKIADSGPTVFAISSPANYPRPAHKPREEA